MAARERTKIIVKKSDPDDSADEHIEQPKRPETGRFRLQVDRQTKASFETFDAAEAAGMVIKKEHPVVRVSIYDAVECVNLVLELPKA